MDSKYLAFQTAVFDRDNWKCVACGVSAPQGSHYNSSDLQAHHKDAQEHFPEKRYDVSNGVTMCCNCHKDYHIWAEDVKYVTSESFDQWMKLTKDSRSYWHLKIQLRKKYRHTCECCHGTWSKNKSLRIRHLTSWDYVSQDSNYFLTWRQRRVIKKNSLVLCTVCDGDLKNWYEQWPPSKEEVKSFLDSGNSKNKLFRNFKKVLLAAIMLVFIQISSNYLGLPLLTLVGNLLTALSEELLKS